MYRGLLSSLFFVTTFAGAGMTGDDGHDERGERDVNDERRREYRERDDLRD